MIIDAVLVDQETSHEAAELQQGVPVLTVASEARHLDRQHRARAAIADGDKQAFETLPRNTASRPTKIVVDDDHILPSESFRPPFQRILPAAALRVVGQLIRRGLSDIQIGVPYEMFRRDLIHQPASPPSLPERTR